MDLIALIKQAAMDAFNASKPTDIVRDTVAVSYTHLNQAKEEVLQAEIQRIRRDGIDNLLLSEYGAKNAKAVKALFSDLEDVDDDNYKICLLYTSRCV